MAVFYGMHTIQCLARSARLVKLNDLHISSCLHLLHVMTEMSHATQ